MVQSYAIRIAETLASTRRSLADVLRTGRYRKIGILTAVAYLVVYLITIQDIVFANNLGRFYPIPSVAISENWTELIWRPRVTFYWEAIGQIVLTNNVIILLSVPNIIVGSVLGALIGLNVAVAAYSYTCARVCRVRPYGGILGAIPSFFTGFACCAPTFAIALLGGNVALTLGILSVRNLFIPVAISAMVLALIWSTRKMGHLASRAAGQSPT